MFGRFKTFSELNQHIRQNIRGTDVLNVVIPISIRCSNDKSKSHLTDLDPFLLKPNRANSKWNGLKSKIYKKIKLVWMFGTFSKLYLHIWQHQRDRCSECCYSNFHLMFEWQVQVPFDRFRSFYVEAQSSEIQMLKFQMKWILRKKI